MIDVHRDSYVQRDSHAVVQMHCNRLRSVADLLQHRPKLFNDLGSLSR